MFRHHQSKGGFRISMVDAVAIVVCAAITLAVRRPLGELAWLFPITLGHFFLFCNVFRVGRYLELAWAGLFVVNMLAWSLADRFSWSHVLTVQTPVTLVVIAATLCSKYYHGIGSGWVGQTRKHLTGEPLSVEKCQGNHV